MKVFFNLAWFFKQEKRAYIIGIIMLFGVALLELVAPKVLGIVVDEINNGTLTSEKLLKWVILLVAVGITMYILRYLWRIMIFGSSLKLARQLRKNLYEHFTKMSPTFYQSRRTGDLMAHATNDIQAIQQTAGSGVLTLVDSLAVGGCVLVAMGFTISWKLTLLSLIPMPIVAISTNYYGTLLHRRFHKAQQSFSEINDKVQESMSGMKVIRSLGQEKEDLEAFRKKSEDVVHKNMLVARIDSLFDPTIALIVGFSFLIAVCYGSLLVVRGELTVGELVTFTTYLGTLVWPMLAFGWLFNIMERGRASYDRVEKILSQASDVVNKENAINTIASGDVSFAIDSFSYKKNELLNLKDIYVNLRKGETLGIVGRTGAGKTTLLKCLIREYDHFNGELKVGERDIRDVTLHGVRSAISYVPQDHFLFSASIGENIAFGKVDATYKEIARAAEIACIHNDIVQFSEGYDTVVGERGVSLSGGQKQRISIARALLTNAEILILDDCLSAVDAKTEETILSALKRERAEKTTIITAHRLSAIQHANIILVIDEGAVVQRGTHEQLMGENGWYKEMYESQQLEALVEKGGV
ncbi:MULTISPECIES: ABC transporter transmembrane domain-containing protein [Bacillus cereus group]|uniref:ABC transporter transmembrane domain-containing protein n=1 Tax=Bacillus cereus group TaxID=86661 RepID=UPI0008724552|nr:MULTISPECIES: ABC transporter transmembrane domain-containing protein [Bacillus cereus group]OFC98240.1 putative multidrug resistance ABC transporter ATP-binding/permease protein YheI [Bacillus thuringiensis]MBJ8046878.1 ATP-binding cassette domain-containing protein [Bacillus cereus group sp. N18]OFD07117.1 putative multidrug resistance ABC transporter ATP-binding/permease protein YheI [Bacillus thuringiensis]PDZ85827.1 ABC transporter ATP-binding protein [Bacillus toyonensis]PEA70932.1 AB